MWPSIRPAGVDSWPQPPPMGRSACGIGTLRTPVLAWPISLTCPRRNRFEKGILLFDSDRQGFFRAAWGPTNENFIAIVPLRSQTPFIVDMR